MAVPPRISGFLSGRGVNFDIFTHAEAFTAVEEARKLGIEAGDVAKVVVIRYQDRMALLVLPARSHADMKAVREALGDHQVRLATENEMSRELPNYAPGTVPPFGELVGAPLYLDAHLAEHETVVFGAGTHTDSIRMRTSDLRTLGPHTIVEICQTAG
jgi:Ala-tRNA(Pro) deacylase